MKAIYNDPKKISKFLSYILRHHPASIGLTLDNQGWADIKELIQCAGKTGRKFSRQQLEKVVAENDKQRFCISEDGDRIRANQGHSIPVDLALTAVPPPEKLYHGTATRFLDAIFQKGLVPGNRHHVHLSQDVQTATKVGQRHGRPTVLEIDTQSMHLQGYQFFCSTNGVWLTHAVPPRFFAVIGP